MQYREHLAICLLSPLSWGCMRAASTWHPWVSGLVGHFFILDLIANCSHTVQYLDCEYKQLEVTLQSLSPVLALYDPFGVDVLLNCDTTTTIPPFLCSA